MTFYTQYMNLRYTLFTMITLKEINQNLFANQPKTLSWANPVLIMTFSPLAASLGGYNIPNLQTYSKYQEAWSLIVMLVYFISHVFF